jgi:sporulation protein YlmC with PRC-barrel domain
MAFYGAAGRVLYAGLSLLDRQLLDRNGINCGNVDDLELAQSEDSGELYVTAILSGPGMLAYRLRMRRWGEWVHRVNTAMSPGDGEGGEGGGGDPNRIPMEVVSDIGDHVDLAVEHGDLGAAGLDHWARRHITSKIPGSKHEAES